MFGAGRLRRVAGVLLGLSQLGSQGFVLGSQYRELPLIMVDQRLHYRSDFWRQGGKLFGSDRRHGDVIAQQ
jgi:hypothetical protein